MRSGGTDLSQAGAPSLSLFRFKPNCQNAASYHAAHFSVGTGAYPIAPTEDFSARPVGDFSDGQKFLLHPEKQKNPRPFPGAGLSVSSFFYATVSPRPFGPHTVARSISAGNFPFVRRYEPWCGRSVDRLRSHRKVLPCVILESVARNIEGQLLPTIRTAITVTTYYRKGSVSSVK